MDLKRQRTLRFWSVVICVVGVGMCVLSRQYTAALWAFVAALTSFQRWMETPQ